MGATLGHARFARRPKVTDLRFMRTFFTVLGPRARSLLLLYLPMSSTYTLSDDCGLTASFTPFGATWLSAKVPRPRAAAGARQRGGLRHGEELPGLHGGPLCQPHRRQPLCAGRAGRSNCRPTGPQPAAWRQPRLPPARLDPALRRQPRAAPQSCTRPTATKASPARWTWSSATASPARAKCA